MEGNGFSGRKDSPTSPSHPSPALVGSQSASFSSTHIETTNVDGFFHLSLGWTSLSSINSLYATPPSSSSSPSSSSTDYLSDVTSTGACFQPERGDHECGCRKKMIVFELEEIKILRGDILRANRSGGRSRLAFVVSDDESSDIEEEEETNGTAE
ncbi:hypothetical protein OIU84_020135 [Salix udensis]|uniref:Uncharacterized protein n=1 Tax=Salix udensis TaxID=889485 RepID=A0AAD6L0I7_9ROSI|nr:hypothetical protein OIU84_020135 [Salix udensis]